MSYFSSCWSLALFTSTLFVCVTPAFSDEHSARNDDQIEDVITYGEKYTRYDLSPYGMADDTVSAEDKPVAPRALTDLIVGLPGVAENGQGGLFQVYSIRGVSRQRVLTMLSGVPLTSDRRAGVAASFIDPLLLDQVDVLRGPASTLYQSGALGGVVQMGPKTFRNLELNMGYQHQGDANYAVLGWGNANHSLGVSRRESQNMAAADGSELNNGHTQYSAIYQGQYRGQVGQTPLDYSWMLAPSLASDIGRSSTRFPGRLVTVPKEKHLVGKFSVAFGDVWSTNVYAHPQKTETRTLVPSDSENTVINESDDLGADFQYKWQGDVFAGLWGVDYFSRRNVTATELDVDFTDPLQSTIQKTLNSAQSQEWALFSTFNVDVADTRLHFGGRYSRIDQKNASVSATNSAVNGYVGIVHPFGKGFELSANMATGFRAPSLTELFFFGTTARGQVIGNPQLESERSLNKELGLNWRKGEHEIGLHLFTLHIKNYIERVPMDPETRAFVNLGSGDIDGLELQGSHPLQTGLTWTWNGTWLNGEDQNGNTLADVPGHRLNTALDWQRDKWGAQVSVQYRRSHDDVGDGEKLTPAATLISLALSRQFGDGLWLSLQASNLLDEFYFSSADELAPLAPGRSIGLALRWSTDS